MANAVYPTGLTAFATAGIDWATDTIKLALLEGYFYNPFDSIISDIGSTVVGTPTTLPARSVVGGNLLADPVTVVSVPAGHTVSAYLIYKDSGTPSTSPLICFADTNSDTTAISVVTDGNNVSVDWSTVVVANRVLKI